MQLVGLVYNLLAVKESCGIFSYGFIALTTHLQVIVEPWLYSDLRRDKYSDIFCTGTSRNTQCIACVPTSNLRATGSLILVS